MQLIRGQSRKNLSGLITDWCSIGRFKKNFFVENTLSPPKIMRLAEKTPQKKIRFDSSNIRHENRVIVFSLKSGDSPIEISKFNFYAVLDNFFEIF